MTLLQNAANDFFDSGLEIKTLQDTQKYIDDYYNSFDKIFKKKISKDTLYDAIIKEAKKRGLQNKNIMKKQITQKQLSEYIGKEVKKMLNEDIDKNIDDEIHTSIITKFIDSQYKNQKPKNFNLLLNHVERNFSKQYPKDFIRDAVTKWWSEKYKISTPINESKVKKLLKEEQDDVSKDLIALQKSSNRDREKAQKISDNIISISKNVHDINNNIKNWISKNKITNSELIQHVLSLSHSKFKNKKSITESISPGTIASVNFSIAKQYFGDIPEYVKLLRNIVEKGKNHKVEVIEDNGKDVLVKPYKSEFKKDIYVPKQALLKENIDKNTSVADLLMIIDGRIWDKHGWISKVDADKNHVKYKSEVFQLFKSNRITKNEITRYVINKLEDENHHSLLQIMKELGYTNNLYESKQVKEPQVDDKIHFNISQKDYSIKDISDQGKVTLKNIDTQDEKIIDIGQLRFWLGNHTAKVF